MKKKINETENNITTSSLKCKFDLLHHFVNYTRTLVAMQKSNLSKFI